MIININILLLIIISIILIIIAIIIIYWCSLTAWLGGVDWPRIGPDGFRPSDRARTQGTCRSSRVPESLNIESLPDNSTTCFFRDELVLVVTLNPSTLKISGP